MKTIIIYIQETQITQRSTQRHMLDSRKTKTVSRKQEERLITYKDLT